MTTYYTRTKGNNIKLTNVNSNVPIGCSEPIVIDNVNSPFTDLLISFNYDNFLYDENNYWPNPQISHPEL